MGVFEGCLIGEEMAYGCSGIQTAILGTCLGVSTAMFIHSSLVTVTSSLLRCNYYHVHAEYSLCCGLGVITTMFMQNAVFVVV